MKKIVYLIIICLSHFQLISQALLSGNLISEKITQRLPISEAVVNGEYEGSPFLIDSFVEGSLKIAKEATYKMPMRYNIYGDVFEVKYKGRLMQLLPDEMVESLHLQNYQLVTAQYELDKKKMKGFLFVLDTGSVNLLKRRNVSFEDWKPARAQEAGPTLARFKEGVQIYFIQIGNKIIQIKNVKELPELFPSNRSKIREYIKEHKIKLKDEKLKELFSFYNGLKKQGQS